MIKFNNSKQITVNKQQRLGNYEEQPLLFLLVNLILCSRGRAASAGIPPISRGMFPTLRAGEHANGTDPFGTAHRRDWATWWI